jgi:hypothetical protein
MTALYSFPQVLHRHQTFLVDLSFTIKASGKTKLFSWVEPSKREKATEITLPPQQEIVPFLNVL